MTAPRWWAPPETPVEPGREASLPSVRLVLAAAAGGFLIAGWFGALMGAAAVLVTPVPAGALPAAVAAAGFLVLAAVTTVIEGPASVVNLDYALARPTAAAAARLAAVALLVALVAAVQEERGAGASAAMVEPRSAAHPRLRTGAVASLAPALVLVAVATVAQSLSGAAALAPEARAVVDQLEAGQGYATAGPAGRPEASAAPPLAPVVAAAVPFGPTAARLVVTGLGVLAAMALAARGGGGRGAVLGAGGVAVLVPLVPGRTLAAALAALLVVAGVRWAWPADVTLWRAAGAGVCLAGAGLARPEAAVVVPVAAIVLGIHLGRRSALPVAALLASALLAWWPWVRWLLDRFGRWWPPLDTEAGEWAGWIAPVLAALLFGGLAGRRRRQGLRSEAVER